MSVTGRSLVKGCVARLRDGEIDSYLVFQFNPTKNTERISPSYSMIDPPGSAFPTAIFKSVSSHEISFRLLLDAVETYFIHLQGVRGAKAFLESLARQDLDPFIEGLGQFVSPPVALVCMGPEAWYCALTDLKFDSVRRNRDLVPTRLWADLTFKTIFTGNEYALQYYRNLSTLRSGQEVSTANIPQDYR